MHQTSRDPAWTQTYTETTTAALKHRCVDCLAHIWKRESQRERLSCALWFVCHLQLATDCWKDKSNRNTIYTTEVLSRSFYYMVILELPRHIYLVRSKRPSSVGEMIFASVFLCEGISPKLGWNWSCEHFGIHWTQASAGPACQTDLTHFIPTGPSRRLKMRGSEIARAYIQCLFNSLRPKNDLHPLSPCNINAT